MTNTRKRIQIRTTSTSGLATYHDTTANKADDLAYVLSQRTSVIEADILVNGEFKSAYINGVRVLN